MLLGEPSHYRNVSQTEVLGRLVRSDSRCRVAERIVVEAGVACDAEYERIRLKPLPPLPSPLELSTPRALMGVEDTFDLLKPGNTPPRRPLLKRLNSSVLARRKEQRVV